MSVTTQTSSPETDNTQAGQPARTPRRNQGNSLKGKPSTGDETPQGDDTQADDEPKVEKSPTPSPTEDEPEAPGAPVISELTAGDAHADLAWSATADRGSAIAGYEILVDNAAVGQVGADQLTYTLTGLTNGTRYGVRVRALNEVGQDDLSAPPARKSPAGILARFEKLGNNRHPESLEGCSEWWQPGAERPVRDPRTLLEIAVFRKVFDALTSLTGLCKRLHAALALPAKRT